MMFSPKSLSHIIPLRMHALNFLSVGNFNFVYNPILIDAI